jgi:hypothetical protein
MRTLLAGLSPSTHSLHLPRTSALLGFGIKVCNVLCFVVFEEVRATGSSFSRPKKWATPLRNQPALILKNQLSLLTMR